MSAQKNDWTYHTCPFCGDRVGRLPQHIEQEHAEGESE
jgi:hypothetical protein